MRFKNIFLVFFGLLALTFPLLPTPVRASDICPDGILADESQKIVKIKLTTDESPEAAGEIRCMAIPKNQTFLSYQDLINAKLPVQTWGQTDTILEAKSCSPDGEWEQISKTKLVTVQMSITGSCAVRELQDEPSPRNAIPINNWKLRTSNDGLMPKEYPKYPLRWRVDFRARDRFLHILGIEEQTATDKEIVNTCRQVVFQKIPQCNDNSSAAQKLITAVSLNQVFPLLQSISTQIGKDCEGAFRKCVADVSKGLEPGTVEDTHANDPRYQRPADYQGPLPDCAFSYDGCRNINDVLEFLIKIGKILFEAIGSVAFVMFIYGGFTMILSMGNSEKVKKGQEILVAAVIGIIIAFGAYLLIDFVLNTLQVGSDFRAINTNSSTNTQTK